MQVESKLRFSISASADNAWNMASSVPSSRHLANRAYTDCQGPYASGNSRHCAPLRAIQSIPLSIFRSSFRGRPRFPVLSGGSTAFTRSHCSFVNSYRFMPLFYTSLSFVQYLFFKQGLVRALRKAGGFANPSCGIHIHLDGANHTPRSIRNFINIVARHNDLFYKALSTPT